MSIKLPRTPFDPYRTGRSDLADNLFKTALSKLIPVFGSLHSGVGDGEIPREQVNARKRMVDAHWETIEGPFLSTVIFKFAKLRLYVNARKWAGARNNRIMDDSVIDSFHIAV